MPLTYDQQWKAAEQWVGAFYDGHPETRNIDKLWALSRDAGLGVIRSIWRVASNVFVKHTEDLSIINRLPSGMLVPRSFYKETTQELSRNYLYTFESGATEMIRGEEYPVVRSIVSDEPLTLGELDNDVYSMLERYGEVEAAEASDYKWTQALHKKGASW